ncbi:protein kinase domain-containing protein [Streptomyces zaomyceticus]|uniref:protein kinase domain-containing protein n=1 Tax=Streptomyces zaomyceticus TaxID=68286 RepID=UPI0037888D26
MRATGRPNRRGSRPRVHPGVTLNEAIRLHGGPLPVESLWRLLRHAAEGLRVVHGADMVHRDLKPSNVMLTGGGLSLIDFGVARAADQSRLRRPAWSSERPPAWPPSRPSTTGNSPAPPMCSRSAVSCCTRPTGGPRSVTGPGPTSSTGSSTASPTSGSSRTSIPSSPRSSGAASPKNPPPAHRRRSRRAHRGARHRGRLARRRRRTHRRARRVRLRGRVSDGAGRGWAPCGSRTAANVSRIGPGLPSGREPAVNGWRRRRHVRPQARTRRLWWRSARRS